MPSVCCSPVLRNSPMHWNCSVANSCHCSTAFVTKNCYVMTHLHLFYARHLMLLPTFGRTCAPRYWWYRSPWSHYKFIHYDIFLVDGRKVFWERKMYFLYLQKNIIWSNHDSELCLKCWKWYYWFCLSFMREYYPNFHMNKLRFPLFDLRQVSNIHEIENCIIYPCTCTYFKNYQYSDIIVLSWPLVISSF